MDVLLADDDAVLRKGLAASLRDAGFVVAEAGTVAEAKAILAGETPPSAVLADLRLPDGSGIEIVAAARKLPDPPEAILITGFATVDSAVAAMRAGAADVLIKPFRAEEAILRLRRIAEFLRLRRENKEFKARLGEPGSLVGTGRAMETLRESIRRIAPSDAPVLIEGESGVGKERVAEAIHLESNRAAGPFVRIHCAVLPETLLEDELFGHEKGAFTDAKERKAGRFERAHGGTAFLDDVDDIPVAVQVKLLRVLQERSIERLGGGAGVPVDIRIVAATKRDLKSLVAEGEFREDLFYRLEVVLLRVPPLRERRDDVPDLVAHFLRLYGRGRPRAVSDEALRALSEFSWPGNVRQLENAVRRALAWAGEDELLGIERFRDALATEAPASGPKGRLDEVLARAEKESIERALADTKGARAESARLLGISRKSLWERMRRLGIE